LQNCWRPLFHVFDKFQECKPCLPNCWRCSGMRGQQRLEIIHYQCISSVGVSTNHCHPHG
jgi:hypothetical protein